MKFDHVAVCVTNVYKSTEWYKKNFNAQVDHYSETWAMLKIGDTKLALVANNTHPPHLALNIDSFDKFPAGSEIKLHRDGSYYLYITDIDGNNIELIYWPKDG